MKRTGALLAFVLCCGMIAGCAARESGATDKSRMSFEAAAPSMAMDASTESAKVAQSTTSGSPASSNVPAALPQERMVIKSATLMVKVRDVTAAFARATQLAENGGGYVQSSTQYAESGERADVTIRVPPKGFLPLIASLESLGTSTSKSISGEDVTQEYYDLSAEMENLTEVRARLFQLLKKAVKVQDAIDVEQELERVGTSLNQVKGRMKYLETMADMSTISLSLYTDEKPSSEGFINWSLIGHGFFRAAQILVNILFVALQVLVVLIPVAAVGGAVAWGIVLLVRLIRARRAPAKSPARKA
jgi:hypothetical protein